MPDRRPSGHEQHDVHDDQDGEVDEPEGVVTWLGGPTMASDTPRTMNQSMTRAAMRRPHGVTAPRPADGRPSRSPG